MFGFSPFSAAPLADAGSINVTVVIASLALATATASVDVEAKATVVSSSVAATSYVGTPEAFAEAVVAVAGFGTNVATNTVDVEGKAVHVLQSTSASVFTLPVVISGDALSFTSTPSAITSSAGALVVAADANLTVGGFGTTTALNTVDVDAQAVVPVVLPQASMSVDELVVVADANLLLATTNTANTFISGVTVDAQAVAEVITPVITSSFNAPIIDAQAVVPITASFLSTTDIGVGTVVYAEAVVVPQGVSAIAITDDPGYLGDEVTTQTVNIFEIDGVQGNMYIGNVIIDAAKFDYESIADLYTRDRTVYLQATDPRHTVVIAPKESNTTIVLNKRDATPVVNVIAA